MGEGEAAWFRHPTSSFRGMLGFDYSRLQSVGKVSGEDKRSYPEISGKEGARVKTKKEAEAEKESLDWKLYLAQVAEYLLAHGHTQALSYVLKQAVTLFHIANTRERKELAEQAYLMRVAQHAEGKDFQKFMKTLE